MNTAEIYTSLAASKPRIDQNAGTLNGVSIITEGQAIGHGAYIDKTTLESVKALASATPGGVRCKVEHGSGFDAVVGCIRNFAIQASKVVGDLHLLKTHQQYQSILEIARSMPESVGLSISFGGTMEELDKKSYFRPTALYSVDLVDYPAANPTGLFSALSAGQKPRKPSIEKLRALANEVFSESQIDAVLQQTPSPEHYSRLERMFFTCHLSVPGISTDFDLSWKTPAPFGLRRVEHSRQQQIVNDFFSTPTK